MDFNGKTIAIVGLSVEGVDSIDFFLKKGCRITCYDQRGPHELEHLISRFHGQSLEWKLGGQYLEDIHTKDIIVRSPGVSLALKELSFAKKEGVVITSQTKLFFDLCPAPIIGVTGTKGKGTTSTLISEMIQASGKKAWLGGNVGVPLLSHVDDIKKDEWVVLELSSFQLEDCEKSPHVAVVLAITQDHLFNADENATNFHTSLNSYIEAKKHIVLFQTDNDIVVVNKNNATSESFAQETKARVLTFGKGKKDELDAYVEDHRVFLQRGKTFVPLCGKDNVQLRGDHNLENIAAASLAAMSIGVPFSDIQKTAQSFKGLEHRLEFVREFRGVSYYNDSFSTVPETAIAAIHSFEEPIIMILGGSEKKSDFTAMGQEIAKSTVKSVILIGQMTNRIETALKNAGFKGKIIQGVSTMHDIVKAAFSEAKKGDVILLSPACASFDMFQNYKERGGMFKHEVSLLS